MANIIQAGRGCGHLAELHTLLRSAWPDFPGFDEAAVEGTIPAPLLAFDGQTLAGGLAFTRYPGPATSGPALWINGLCVATAYRRRGIATSLVQRSREVAAGLGEPAVYARTQLPDLYRRCGWRELGRDGENVILGLAIDTKPRAAQRPGLTPSQCCRLPSSELKMKIASSTPIVSAVKPKT